MKTVLVLIATVLSFSMAQAQTPATPPMGKDHPCKKIMEACTAAGFKKGEWKVGKGLYKNCMHPIMEGQTVPGVSVTSGDVQSCKAHKAAHKEKMEEMHK
jgi:hypothetical protein